MSKVIDTREQKVGQNQEHVLPASGPIDRSEFEDDFEIIDTPNYKDLAAREAFYEEFVEVMINDATTPNAEQTIQVGVNGLNQFFIRGQSQKVKRKFVEGLARAKQDFISTPEIVNPNNERTTKINKVQNVKYAFSVIHDPNPMGREWLLGLLQEAS